MLSLRRETEYAVQMLRVLSKSNKDTSLKDVSEEIGASFLFLQKIARKLRQAKLISAGKGVNGGYSLLISPKKLSLGKIIAVTENACELLPCCQKKFLCSKSKNCALKGKVLKVNDALNSMLAKIKLSDL
ncbi:MAG: Rrf2 family transcriptional regulator [Candidatus Magasanikbacteria bacterium]|jgi:Rrf2 family protein